MELRGKTIVLNKKITGFWRDPKSGITLHQFGKGNDIAIIPTDLKDTEPFEKAIQFKLLLLEGKEPKPAQKKPKAKSTQRKQAGTPKKKVVTGEPKDLLKMTSAQLTKNVLPHLTIEQLSIMIALESNGKNTSGKPRTGLITSIQNQLKKKGANESLVYDADDTPVWARKFDQERGFPGEPKDQPLARKTQDLKPE